MITKYPFNIPFINLVFFSVDYKEELTDVVKAHIDDKAEQEVQLCFEVTDACVGVDRSQFRINKYKGPVSITILSLNATE